MSKPKKKSAVRNPGIRIPNVVVELGHAVELGMDDGNSLKFNSYLLTCNESGSRLFIIRSTKKTDPEELSSKKAEKLYSKFTDFVPDRNYGQRVSEAKLKLIGQALFIVYRSNKWTGKKTDYIHHFEKPPNVYANKKHEPTALAIIGRLAVRKEGITG